MSLHPFYRSVVAMFCGPHDDGDSAPTRRIDRAIELSLELCSPLLIAGDGNFAEDLQFFSARAEEAGVLYVRWFYERLASTRTDAQSIVNEIINNPPFIRVANIHLVTDDWHMARAAAMLEGEQRHLIARDHHASLPTVHRVPVITGLRPPDVVLAGERQGLADYLAGRYGERKAHPPFGKPCEEART